MAEAYEGEWHRTFNAAGIRQEHFNGRMLLWINAQLGSSHANLAEAQQGYAAHQGAVNWSSLPMLAGGAPSWLPAGAYLHVDRENGHYYWDGRVRQLSDLTAVGGGVYDLLNPPNFPASEYTASVDYTYNPDFAGSPPSGTLFSLTDGAYRAEFFVYDISADSKLCRLVVSGPTFVQPRFGHPDDAGSVDGRGRRRVQLAAKGGEKGRTMVDNYIMEADAGANLSTPNAPTRIRFGGNARFENDPLTNGTLHRVTIWPTARTQAQMDAHAVNGVAPAYHLLGDSFLNLQRLKEQIMLLHQTNGYIGTSQDGVGGTSITQQAARFASPYTKWWSPTLVIMDGGFDGTSAQAVTALDSIRSNLGHDRWVFCGSSPQRQLPGSAGRIQFDADMDASRAYCGAHFLETLGPLLNTNAAAGTVYHDGSANDLADIANQIWPRSLCVSHADFHPSPTPNSAGWSGWEALGDVIHKGLVARGYLDAYA